MASLIVASMNSFLWTCCLMLIMMSCFAILFTELSTQVREDADLDSQAVQLAWGSVMQSVHSLFMSITGGDDYRNFIDPYRGHALFVPVTIFFSFYVAFATLVMLNLVTGVFVEGAQRIIKEDKQKEKITTAAKIFIDVGMEADVSLSREEFLQLLDECPLLREFLIDLGIDADEAETLFTMFDRDGSGDVSLAEFITSCLTMGKPATSGELYNLRYEQKADRDKLKSDIKTHTENFLQIELTKLTSKLLAKLDQHSQVVPILDQGWLEPVKNMNIVRDSNNAIFNMSGGFAGNDSYLEEITV